MKGQALTRNILQIVSRYSNVRAATLKQAFAEEQIYPDRTSWIRFIDLVLISIGTAFCLAGVLFFLAYNWHDMHKFLKLGLVEVLVIAIIAVPVMVKLNQLLKNILLLAASVLVGGMFAVFGQIYQTGADAYDFFLGWTVFVAIWVVVSNFPPLILGFLALLNITFILYVSQTGPNWSFTTTIFVLSVFNKLVLELLRYLSRRGVLKDMPKWFWRVLDLAVIYYVTYGMISCIFERRGQVTLIFSIFTLCYFVIDTLRSYKAKTMLNLCVIPLSLILIISAAVLRSTQDTMEVFLLLSIFVILSITLLISRLIKLNKIWNEQH